MNDIDLTEFFQTKSQAVDFSSRLTVISENAYKAGFDLEKSLLEQLGIEKKEKMISLLRENITSESPSDLKSFIENLQKKIESIPVISLQLAFEPSEEILKSITEWFVINLKKQILLDINVDKGLIGGVVINYNGEFKSYSIKPKFDAIINEYMDITKTNTTQHAESSTLHTQNRQTSENNTLN